MGDDLIKQECWLLFHKWVRMGNLRNDKINVHLAINYDKFLIPIVHSFNELNNQRRKFSSFGRQPGLCRHEKLITLKKKT